MQISSRDLASHPLRLHSSSSLHADPGRQQSSPAAILMVSTGLPRHGHSGAIKFTTTRSTAPSSQPALLSSSEQRATQRTSRAPSQPRDGSPAYQRRATASILEHHSPACKPRTELPQRERTTASCTRRIVARPKPRPSCFRKRCAPATWSLAACSSHRANAYPEPVSTKCPNSSANSHTKSSTWTRPSITTSAT
jgi:hypothetical protein